MKYDLQKFRWSDIFALGWGKQAARKSRVIATQPPDIVKRSAEFFIGCEYLTKQQLTEL
ncbi:MAG: hypothetical protein ACRERS_01045 [Methylococcales bacterium]